MQMENSKFLINPGDSLIIETRPNHNGNYLIQNPEFEFDGIISENSFVNIYFRKLSNGVIYSNWERIGTQTERIQSHQISYNLSQGEILQIRLERSEYEEEGSIEFVKFYTEGSYTLISKETPTLDASMFSGVNSDKSIIDLENNLFKKLYFRGILPNYIQRGANRIMDEDRDFVALFSSIARFFALIIKFFKRWENVNNDEEMLKETLRNHGIQFDESNVNISDLKVLVNNTYNEFMKRGTKEILILKGESRADKTKAVTDGELIRLIRAKEYTEVLYENIPKENLGWCLGKSSPMYRGMNNENYALSKIGVNRKFFNSIEEVEECFSTFGNVVLGDERVNEGYPIRLGENSGIGRDNANADVDDKLIPIDAYLDYELTLGFRVIEDNDGKIMAYVEGFNSNKIKLVDSFITPDKTTVVMTVGDEGEEITCGNFFQNEDCPLNRFRMDTDYYVRFIIKAYASSPQNNYKLNIGYGNELHFNNSFIKYILPTIKVTDGSIDIFDIHLRPLVRGTNINPIIGKTVNNSFSLGFIQVSNFSHVYMRNRNTNMSENDVRDFADRYLLPYNATSIITFIK